MSLVRMMVVWERSCKDFVYDANSLFLVCMCRSMIWIRWNVRIRRQDR